MSRRNALVYLLAVCVGVELLLFVWLCSLGRPAFSQFIWTPDTPSYLAAAVPLAETFSLKPGPRTLGYPLFLAVGYLIGGEANGMYVIIFVQLILNIVLTWGGWRLIERIVPAATLPLRAVATVLLFWAGLGMALYLMSDFLAALTFGIFLYGILFWRTPLSVLFSGSCLAWATLTRPTFTFVPLVLPIIAYLVGRFTSKVPWSHLVAFAAFSVGATGVSVAYQYTANNYVGPAPALALPIQETLYYGVVEGQGEGTDYATFQKEFTAAVERRAGRQFATLSLSEREMYAKQIFREQLSAHPRQIITNYVTNFIKYVFVPVESLVMRLVAFNASEQTYFTYVRPILGLVCLPIWLLSLLPPIGSSRQHKMYYLLVLTTMLYVVGLSAIGSAQGERYRFPVLAFMLSMSAWNAHRVHGYLQGSSFRVLRHRILRSRHT